MFLRRFLLLALIVGVIAVVINFIGSRDKPYYSSVNDTSVKKIGNSGYALKGKLSFFNPSIFSAKLSSLQLSFFLNNEEVGKIDQPIDGRISAAKTYSYPFEIRFADIPIQDSVVLLRISGLAESGGFNGYSIQISDTAFVSVLK